MVRVSYEEIRKHFEENECKLLTTKEEFINNKLSTNSKYSIVASCSHQIDNCWYNMFKNRGSGKICKKCINKHASQKNIKLNENKNYSLKY
jgi:hypothetical protein